MTTTTYTADRTALLIVDPYNDFMREGGKLYEATKEIEYTARFGMELGYHVTLIKDATAAFSHEGMHAAHEVNGPLFAHALLTTAELLARLPS